MDSTKLRQLSQFLGANKVSGMAQKVGLTYPPPPTISVRHIISLAQKPPRPPPPPPPDQGVAKVTIYNCNVEYREIYIWVSEISPNPTDYQQKETLEDQYVDGRCPGEGVMPAEIDLEDGHYYEIVAVDPELVACDGNDPHEAPCRRAVGYFLGGKSGEVQWNVK